MAARDNVRQLSTLITILVLLIGLSWKIELHWTWWLAAFGLGTLINAAFIPTVRWFIKKRSDAEDT